MKKILSAIFFSFILLSQAGLVSAADSLEKKGYNTDTAGWYGTLQHNYFSSPPAITVNDDGQEVQSSDQVWVWIDVPKNSQNQTALVKGINLTIHDHDEGGEFKIYGYREDENGNLVNVYGDAGSRDKETQLLPQKNEGDYKWRYDDIDTLGEDDQCGSSYDSTNTYRYTDRYHPEHASSKPDHNGCLRYHPVVKDDPGVDNDKSKITNATATFHADGSPYSYYDLRNMDVCKDDGDGCRLDAIRIKLKWEGYPDATQEKLDNFHYHIGSINFLIEDSITRPINLECNTQCVSRDAPTRVDNKLSYTWDGGSGVGMVFNITQDGNSMDGTSGVFWNRYNTTGNALSIIRSEFSPAGIAKGPLTLVPGTKYRAYVLEPKADPPQSNTEWCTLEWCTKIDPVCNESCASDAQCQQSAPEGEDWFCKNLGTPQAACRLRDDPSTLNCDESESLTCSSCGGGGNSEFSTSFASQCEPAIDKDVDPPICQNPGELSYKYTINYSNVEQCNLNYSDVFISMYRNDQTKDIIDFLGKPDYPVENNWYGYVINVVAGDELAQNGLATYEGMLNNGVVIGRNADSNKKTIQQLYDFVNSKDGVDKVIDLGANVHCFPSGEQYSTAWIGDDENEVYTGQLYLDSADKRSCLCSGKISGNFYLSPDATCKVSNSTLMSIDNTDAILSTSPDPTPAFSLTKYADNTGYSFLTTPDAHHSISLQLATSTYSCSPCNAADASGKECVTGAEPGDEDAHFFVYDVAASAKPWWQTWGGLVYGHQNIISNIPLYSDECELSSSCEPYLITAINSNSKSAGIPLTSKESILSSILGFLTQNGDTNKYAMNADMQTGVDTEDFQYFANEVDLGDVQKITDATISDLPTGTTKGSGDGAAQVSIREGNLTVSPNNTIVVGTDSDKNIIFVTGDLIFNQPGVDEKLIDTSSGNFLGFVVGGNVIINGSVGNEEPTNSEPNIEAVIVADKEIQISPSNKRLVMAGSFVGWEGIQFGRKFDDNAKNLTIPVETFVHRSDFVTNTPDILKSSILDWKEVN